MKQENIKLKCRFCKKKIEVYPSFLGSENYSHYYAKNEQYLSFYDRSIICAECQKKAA